MGPQPPSPPPPPPPPPPPSLRIIPPQPLAQPQGLVLPPTSTLHHHLPLLRSPPSPRRPTTTTITSLDDPIPYPRLSLATKGVLLLLITVLYATLGIGLVVWSYWRQKEPSLQQQHPVNAFLQDAASYYACLWPLVVGPVIVSFVFWNWLGMKFFRHNV
ncbi:hypothetical protein BC832DRAFT_157738 [Gaertneriomyces semiglobifer]|nr:hypothetical protein BC832DRAFT_157738 [Gaertneriomyces semiglobifer]